MTSAIAGRAVRTVGTPTVTLAVVDEAWLSGSPANETVMGLTPPGSVTVVIVQLATPSSSVVPVQVWVRPAGPSVKTSGSLATGSPPAVVRVAVSVPAWPSTNVEGELYVTIVADALEKLPASMNTFES